MLPVVYKYRPINPHTREFLEENIIYFPRHTDLNDPFECQTEYVAKANPLRRFLYFYRYASSHNDFKSFKERLQFALTSLKPHYSKERERNAIEKANEWYHRKIGSAGTLTFTEKNDDILMWSHYADHHKGICLEFNFNGDKTFGEDPFWKVIYRRSYPSVNFYSSKHDSKFKKICMTKAYVWRYEKERRLVWEEGGKTYSFCPRSLTGVIFGCRVEEGKKNEILEILKKRKSPIKIYDAKMDVHEFKIDIVKSSQIGDRVI